MTSHGQARKYASNRRLEIQLKKELEAVKSKALLERYAKQRGSLPPVSPPARKPSTYLPSKAQPKSLVAATRKERGVQLALHQPATSDTPDASQERTSHRDKRSAKPVKSSSKSLSDKQVDTKVGSRGEKQPASQKFVVDTSQKVKFAITKSQNTSVQMKYADRQADRIVHKESVQNLPSKQSNVKKPSRLKQERSTKPSQSLTERQKSRPVSHATATDSRTSYQHYIISQTTDYIDGDSNITSQTVNTPAPFIIEQGVSVSVSGVGDSFQPSRVDLSGEVFQEGEDEISEMSDSRSQSLLSSCLERRSDDELFSRSDTSNVGERMDSAKVSMSQSGRVTIEVDMRFGSMDHHASEFSEHSTVTTGDQLSIPTPDEETCTVDQDESQHLLSHNVEPDSEVNSMKMESDKASSLTRSDSTLSVDSSEGQTESHDQESELESEQGEFSGADKDEYGSDLQLHPSTLMARDAVEVGSQPYSGTVSRSSISPYSEVDSEPRSAYLSGQTDSVKIGDLNTVLSVASEKALNSLASQNCKEEKSSGVIDNTDEPKQSRSSEHLSAIEPGEAKTISASTSSSTLQASPSSPKLTSPYSRSLSSVGMPFSVPSHVTTTTSDSQNVTPPHSVTSQPRSSFGSIDSSVHSIKPSSSHVLEGLRLFSNSSHADTSSWLLAHHSVSKVKEEDEELGYAEDNIVKESSHKIVDDVESEVASDGSTSLLKNQSVHGSHSQLSSLGSREDSSIKFSSTKSIDIGDDETQQSHGMDHRLHDGAAPANIVCDDIVSFSKLVETVDPKTDASISREHVVSAKALEAGLPETQTQGAGAEVTTDTRDSSYPTSAKLAEYLAFSDKPVTLEDIMHISGQAIAVQTQPPPSPKQRDKVATLTKIEEPKVRFLSTWDASRSEAPSLHRSIHHFCTEPSIPQLPIHLQILSKQTHANPVDVTRKRSLKDEETDKQSDATRKAVCDLPATQICPPPNTPFTTTGATSVTKRQRTPALDQDEERSASKMLDSLPSGGRPSTVDVKRSSQFDDDEDDIVKRAKSQLEKELRREHRDRSETKPSTAEAHERGRSTPRRKTTKLITNLQSSKKVESAVGASRMKVAQDPSNLLWVPAPPKLSFHPSTVQSYLFPDYRSSAKPTTLWTSPWQHIIGFKRTAEHEENTQPESYQKKLLPLSFSSVKDMSLLSKPAQDNITVKIDSTQPTSGEESLMSELKTPTSPTMSTLSGSEKQSTGTPQQEAPPTFDAKRAALARRRHTVFISSDNQTEYSLIEKLRKEQSSGKVEGKDAKHDVSESVRKTQSMPQIIKDGSSHDQAVPLGGDADSGGRSEEFKQTMEEVERLREQLVAFHKQQSEEDSKEEADTKKEGSDKEEDAVEQIEPLEGSMLATSGAFTSRKLQRQAMKAGKRVGGTGRNATGRVRALRRTRSAQIRAQQAREILSQPPKTLKRTTSFPLLKDELFKNTVQVTSKDYRRSRRESLPSLLTDAHFQSLKHHIETIDPLVVSTTHVTTSDASYQWALNLWWDRWFPEVLQEYKEIVASYSIGKRVLNFGGGGTRGRDPASTNAFGKVKSDSGPHSKDKLPAAVVEPATPQIVRLVNMDPLSSLSVDKVKQFETEVLNLTKSMSTCRDSSMRAVFLCRRGALLRKLGRLRDSMSDLKSALSLQSTLSDALWHRHLLYLVQGDEQMALMDLNSLLKCNKRHFGAFRSRVILLLRRGDTSKAVFNLSQAIALQPRDAEMYFLRAELFEKRGEVVSALSDYAKVTELQPRNKEAISRQAMHKFKRGMWGAATQNFNALLQLDPNNTQARIHRAKAQYNLGRYVAALQDLSAAIHLDPNGAQAFYHRACLLRTSQPKQALRDLSISLLLDDSASNVSAYIHRGILYTQINCYSEALSDFEVAIKLQRSLPSPHICAGLIHMLERRNLPRAVRCFTAAITVDPTCIRAYLCRAEAFKKSEMFEQAILDCTRLIHLKPDNPTYYLRKGELFLSLKNFKMAAELIRTAAKLCHSGFDQSKTQQALVESFLDNHSEAVALLRTMLRSPAVFTLMGKIQYKAKLFDDAAGSFRQAIALVERSLQPKYMVAHMSELHLPKSAVTRKVRGDIHFQCGRSLVEGGSLEEAIDEFSEVLKHCPDNAMAYYERGVAKLKAGGGKGIYDLNRSLAIDPKLFQAFLARAAHYGRTGRHSKAILNCNEAIKLVPNSVRAHLCRGALKYHVKLYSGAIEDLNTAISLDPTHAALAYFNRALCFEATGNLHQALTDYSTVLLLQESGEYVYKVYVNRGLVYLRLKDFANALLDFLKAKKVWTGADGQESEEMKGDPAIQQAIGYCHHQLGSLDLAIKAYSQAIEQDPSFLEAYVGRGNVYMDFLSEEGFTKCKEDYLHVLELDGSYLPARVNLAFLLQAEGHYKQAWDELTHVLLEGEKSFAPALEARSIISLQMGNTFGALLDINNALKLVQSAALLTNRGVIHQFMGDVVNAMRDYQQAVAMEPDYFLAHFNIGNVLFQQRHFKQAIRSYSKALSSCQDDTVLLNRAITFSILNETDRALKDFDLAIELNPHSAPSYFNRGNLHRSLGNYSNAEQDYKKALELQPEDWLTMYYYGEVVGRQRRLSETRDIFRQAAEIEIR